MTQANLPPPPRTVSDRVLFKWFTQIHTRLVETSQILWDQVDKADSILTDIVDRSHSLLQNVLGADDTDTDVVQVRHISNDQAKTWTDAGTASSAHIAATNAHGATGTVIGAGDIATPIAYGVVLQGAAVADVAAPAAYSAHASGAVPVTSNAATDLDTTSAALATLRGEVDTLTTQVNGLLAALRASDALDT